MMMCQSPIPKAHQRRIIDVHKSQKSTAVLKSLDQAAVLAWLSVPITQTTAEIIEDMPGPYAAPDGDKDPGLNWESTEVNRTRLKHKADCISRSQYEVYSLQLSTMFRRLLWMNCWRCSVM